MSVNSTRPVVALALAAALPLILQAGCGDSGGDTPPTAVLTGPSYCDLGSEITLDGSGSTDPDNDIVRYRFVIADGTTAHVVTSSKARHTCHVEGLIGVTLFVEDAAGNEATASMLVSVRPP